MRSNYVIWSLVSGLFLYGSGVAVLNTDSATQPS